VYIAILENTLESLRKIIANMGFILQVSGLLLILPIVIGLQNNELQSVASIIVTCFIAFGVGFAFNSFAQHKELDEKTSLWLMLLTFTIIPLILMIPYIWNNVFNSTNPLDLFTNSYFETISGFTTTGFSIISNPQALPLSLLFYRSLVEFIGGVGFIYILIAFMCPQEDIDKYLNIMGIERITDNYRKMLISIMIIYTIIVAVFTAIFYYTYSTNLIFASCAAMDILTGGYQPNITAGIGIFQASMILLMFLGGINFRFLYNFFHLKIRELITPEIKLYLIIIGISTIIISLLAWINPFDALFHTVSMLSSTGIQYVNINSAFPPAAIYFFILILIGGCSFSQAGGIKISRIKQIIDAIRKNEDAPTKAELRSIAIYLITFIIILILLSIAFSASGTNIFSSIFEVGSALATNGVSSGATTLELPAIFKWILIVAMFIGRIEILTIYKAIRGPKN
jgi:trk system potassium uptake protein TrkH